MKAAGAEEEGLEAVVENDDWVLWAEEVAGVVSETSPRQDPPRWHSPMMLVAHELTNQS